MRRLLLALFIVFVSAGVVYPASPAEMADSAYNSEDYRQAIRLYHQAIDTEGFSPRLYYNLANAYYRINNLGRAVLYYERALNLDPSMSDARSNLEFVRTRILDKPEDDSTFLENLNYKILSLMSPDAWAWTAFGLFVLVLGCVALYIFSSEVALRKTGFFGGFVILILFAYSSINAWRSSGAYYEHSKAVVTVPTSNLRTAPGSESVDGDKVLPIHEGTVLEIIDSVSLPTEQMAPKWYNVKINNSTRAWVNAADVEII